MKNNFEKIIESEINNLSSSVIFSGDKNVIQYTYKATSTISNIVHNLDYSPTTDKLFCYYGGVLMEKAENYIENSNNISIDLVGWSLSNGETIDFILFK